MWWQQAYVHNGGLCDGGGPSCAALLIALFFISAAEFPETWCCQIASFVESVLASFHGKAFLKAFSQSKEERNFERKGTKQLGSKLFQQVWINQGEFNIGIFWSLFATLPVAYGQSIVTMLLPLRWWKLNQIFLGPLWGSILYAVMLGIYD